MICKTFRYIIPFARLMMLFCFAMPLNAQVSTFSRFGLVTDTTSLRFDPSRPYYIIRATGQLPKNYRLIRSFDDSSAIVELSTQDELILLKAESEILPASNEWKCSPSLQDVTGKGSGARVFIVTVSDLPRLLEKIKNWQGIVELISIDQPSRSVVLRSTLNHVRENMLPLKEVIFADILFQPQAEIGIIGYNRSFHGLSTVDFSIPGANGRNIVVGVKEQKMQPLDLDLYRRVLNSPIEAPSISNHATVISSIIGGAGNSFYDGRGIAYGCRFFPSSFSNLFPDNITTLNTAKVSVQNHSYGTIVQQFYGAEAVSYDAQTWQKKELLHVFSAGNQGTAAAPDGRYANIPGYANLTGNFKMSKNIITVGAIDNKGIIPAESSAGPLYDGRVAPQLIALGPNGTSDAAGIVSGTIAVLQQVYADSNNQAIPPASLIKAILYNNADDVYRQHIDYKTGYGLLNSYEAVKALQRKEFDGGTIGPSQQWTKTITIPANIAQLKLTLAWTDSSSLPNNNKALLNDIDLELIQVSSGTIFRPWVLSAAPHPDSLSRVAVRKRDSLNTAEQISLAQPAAGDYLVRVTGTSIPGTAIPFHIAIHTDTLNTFHFTSPQHSSDVNREENADLDIRWRTFVADTNETGNLYISYNGGINWQLVKAAHKIFSNYYQWGIKDTSSRALFKMETSFGDFFSREFVIHKVTRLNVDFLCADSFRLSWKKHLYANGYKLYTLVDSPYLKHFLTLTDSFVVMDRSQYPGTVYAVEPELSNSIPATRSIAQDINFQGVKCFYKTFYYTLLDENKLDLLVELSAPDYADSLFFEQVDANGQLIRVVGSLDVNSQNAIYRQFADKIPGGTSYWRVRIKLKSGAIVFTEIISVLTSGTRYLLFYPNPARRDNSIMYVIKQGLPADSRLQLFDMTGRLVRDFIEMPGNFSLKGIPVGILVYKLLSRDGSVLETGKLLIMH